MTFIESAVDTSYGKITFKSVGDYRSKTCIVFLHDAIGSASIWGSFPMKVYEATQLPVIVFDRLGYGKSEADNRLRTTDYLQYEAEIRMPELFEKLGIDAPILIGHSDGGSIALVYAASFQTEAVFSMAAHVYEEETTRQGIIDFTAQKDFDVINSKLEKHHGSKTKKLISAWRDTWLTEEYRTWNIESYLPKISCPVFAIQGENDEYATAQHLLDIQKGIGENCQIKFIENCGHVPYKEKTDESLMLALDFISQIEH
jgi:pimeloyl-ACP methyl ester carboxylesterase